MTITRLVCLTVAALSLSTVAAAQDYGSGSPHVGGINFQPSSGLTESVPIYERQFDAGDSDCAAAGNDATSNSNSDCNCTTGECANVEGGDAMLMDGLTAGTFTPWTQKWACTSVTTCRMKVRFLIDDDVNGPYKDFLAWRDVGAGTATVQIKPNGDNIQLAGSGITAQVCSGNYSFDTEYFLQWDVTMASDEFFLKIGTSAYGGTELCDVSFDTTGQTYDDMDKLTFTAEGGDIDIIVGEFIATSLD